MKLPIHVDLDDLVQAGTLGLIDAATKFDPTRRTHFRTYAKHRIRGAILDSLRKSDWASRPIRKQKKRIQNAVRELADALHRTPTEEEVAAKLGMDLDAFHKVALTASITGPVSLTAVLSSDRASPIELPTLLEKGPDALCANHELLDRIRSAVRGLPDRTRQVIELIYVHEWTMKEVGRRIGVNESRVSQLHKTAMKKLGRVLRQGGVRSSTPI